jgi:predicted RNase H-like nuclease (RuvC/YqgF family)
MKKLTGILIILLVLYFVIGYVLVVLNLMRLDAYNQIATVLGGIFSGIGLLAFVIPSVKTSDIKNIEIETLKSLAKTAEEIQKKEEELKTRESDISRLELQKEELEFLVKKASLNLFFKEQLERYYETLDNQISRNREINQTLNEIRELEFKVSELDIEIDANPNAEYILEIIHKARGHRRSNIEISTPFDGVLKILNDLSLSITDRLAK